MSEYNALPWSWVYCGPDYQKLQAWERRMPETWTKITLGPLLHDAAGELKAGFLDAVAALGRKHNSIAWWLSEIAERNPTISPLFLNCCYLKAVMNIVEKTDRNLCIIAESEALLDTLDMHLERDGDGSIEVVYPDRVPRLIKKICRAFDIMFHAAWHLPRAWFSFLKWRLGARRAARASKKKFRATASSGDMPAVLLHTFIDESCFQENGGFAERYWGCLPQWLEKKGYRVAFIPYLYNLQRSAREAYAWLRSSTARFYIPEDYYSLLDYLKTFLPLVKLLFLPRGRVAVGDLDITELVREERKRQVLGTRVPRALLYYYLPRRLKQRGVRADYIMMTFENHIWEKMLLLGFKKNFPAVKAVGFQHSSFSPFYLCNLILSGEADIAPYADRIVCNGEFFKNILIQHGLPVDCVVTGSALRYEHIQNTHNDERRCSSQHTTILVALPLEEDSVNELIKKTAAAFSEDRSFSVWVKPHPLMPGDAVLRAFGGGVPKNFKIIHEKLDQLLAEAGVLITTGSTASFEALARGVSIVRVGRETNLDLDPLLWFEDYAKTCYTPVEIREETMRLLMRTEDKKQRAIVRAQEIIRACFNPVTDEGLLQFLPELHER